MFIWYIELMKKTSGKRMAKIERWEKEREEKRRKKRETDRFFDGDNERDANILSVCMGIVSALLRA